MSWKSFTARFGSNCERLPLIIAGPMLRRVDPNSATVWVAMKAEKQVRLYIYKEDNLINPHLISSIGRSVKLGKYLYIYSITFSNVTDTDTPAFESNTNYVYDLEINGQFMSETQNLDLTYFGATRPSFSLPPNDLNKVRIIHGSCRKPHGEGFDALEAVDKMLKDSIGLSPIRRPHQLFLTGDQIYADDVADAMLFMIQDAAAGLQVPEEDLGGGFTESDLKIGKRHLRLQELTGFTSMIPGKPEYAKSHLLKFREYCLMYLFAWSPVLWPADLPSMRETFGDEEPLHENIFEAEIKYLQNFRQSLVSVRRALANVPTFMIMDDHEITDDWNLNWKWCKEVYSKTGGRIAVCNGLLAYTLCQAWSNDPDQFEPSQPGEGLLNAIDTWSRTGTNDPSLATFFRLLTIPEIQNVFAGPDSLSHNEGAVNWHYRIDMPLYDIVVLDLRTMRGYPDALDLEADVGFTALLSEEAIEIQLPESERFNKDVTIIVSPTPVIGVPLVEEHLQLRSPWKLPLEFIPAIKKDKGSSEYRLENDAEAWGLNKIALERFYAALAKRSLYTVTIDGKELLGRFIFLSGDVHYGFSVRKQLWSKRLFEEGNDPIPTNVIFAQLTASSIKNSIWKTRLFHYTGFLFSKTTDASFGWIVRDRTNGVEIGLKESGPFFMGGISWDFILLLREKLEEMNILELTTEPDWTTRTDFISAATEISEDLVPDSRIPNPNQVMIPPDAHDRALALAVYLSAAEDHDEYFESWGDGREVVGRNNLGEVTFQWTTDDKKIVHTLWWRMSPEKAFQTDNLPLNPSTDELPLFPVSTFKISLNLEEPELYPKPQYP